jgi:hypothetical protein
VRVSPAASPPAGFTDPIAYDAATKQLVLFDSSNGGTWLWNGTTWTPAVPTTRPSTRAEAVLAYDGATHQLILFGGEDSSGALNTTWNWTGSNWVQLSPANSPPPTTQGSIAYDASSRQLLLFGGVKIVSGSQVFSNDTWSWDGSTWTQLNPTASPPARLGAALGYDAATSQLLLFGGASFGNLLGDTWSWTGSNWSKLSPGTSPAGRSFPELAYDSATRQILLQGGARSSTPPAFNDTWAWSGSSWVRQAPTTVLNPARYGASMAYDDVTGQLVLFGGASNATTSLGDTWLWTPLAVQTASLPTGAVSVPYSATLQAVGGTGPYVWSVSSGALPAGLSLSANGVISGTPTTAGSGTFTLRAVDSTTGTPQQASRSLTLTINPAPRAGVWVGNGLNSDVNGFDLTATGNATPFATLSGQLTGLSGIGGLAFDSAGQLWAVSAGSDAIEQFAPGASGNVAPSRLVAGPNTAIVNPSGLAIDASGRVYVANAASNQINVYPADANGNTPPQRAIAGPDTGLSTPTGITVDHAGHIWVANQGADSLTEYAANASGDSTPLASISGPSTQLNHPQGLGQDSGGNLLVANFFGASVLKFGALPPFGDVAPKFTISGPQSQLSSPQAVDVDTANRIYVADIDKGLVIFKVGATAPTAVVTGSDIKAPGAVAVAPPLTVTTSSLPRAALGHRYRARLAAILGRAPLRWRLSKGKLPRGLRFHRSGQITGVARKPGRYRFTVSVRDAGPRAQTTGGRVTLVVARRPTVIGVHRSRGSRRGGRTVTISGTGFSKARGVTTVSFGRIRALRVRCPSKLRCTVRTPPGARRTVGVTVTVGGLSSAPSRRARYTYTR